MSVSAASGPVGTRLVGPCLVGPCLVGDIGATNARFALAGDGTLQFERSYRCADFPSLADVVRRYWSDSGITLAMQPHVASMAIAAPLLGDRVAMSNHNWSFSVAELRQALGFNRVVLLNDFTALALSIRHLAAGDLRQVGGGVPTPGAPLALLGPGSGLGVSGLLPAGDSWQPIMGEGGHATLPVSSEREHAVVRALLESYEHVSAERILSGPGLLLLYRTLCLLDGAPADADSVAVVTQRAQAGEVGHSLEAVQMFCAWLGTVAGDLTLTLGARGGCYIGGGVTPRFVELFAASGFRARFEAKGRYRSYLAPVPVYVITVGNATLTGCARALTDPSPRIESVG